MAISRRRVQIGNADSGIFLTVLTDKKLKTNSFIFNFMTEHSAVTAAENAAIAFMIEDTCREYPDITSFLRRQAELYGANVRCGVSRFSDNQVISLSGGCVSDKYALEGEQISYELLKLLIGCLFEPVTEDGTFPQKQFALKQQELIDDIEADINDKRIYAIKQARASVYENEPAGIPLKGEAEDAEGLTSEQVYNAYRRMLKTARIEIIFVGNELTESCEQLINQSFGAMERDNIWYPGSAPSPAKPEVRYVTERLDVVQSKMVMAFKYNTEGNLEAVAKLFNAVFGATPFSMLFKNVREKLSLCYYCSSSYNDDKRTVFVDSGVEAANISAAQDEIIRQLDAVRNGEFSDELFNQSKLYIICALKGVNDTPRAVADWYFDYCLESEENVPTPELFIERVTAVTKEDVCAFAKALSLDTVYVLTGKEN